MAVTAGAVARPASSGVVRRRTGLSRLSPTGTTTPDRLRRVATVLVLGCLTAAAVSLVSGLDRAEAVRDADTRLAALTTDAAVIYRVLADADASATSGYVAGGREPAEVRARYDADITIAAQRLVHAASLLPEGDQAVAPVTTLTTQLPVYAGLMETARTYNRQGLPLGQSYLTRASRLMQSTMLPAAAELRTIETDRLTTAYRQGAAAPLAVLVLGLGMLAAVIDLAIGERARTNRVLNPGLVGCAAAVLAALVWWALAWVFAGTALDDAGRHTSAVTALDDAHTAVLQARSNESLVLVARGGGAADRNFEAQIERVVGQDGQGGLLAEAQADGATVTGVRDATLSWQQAHRQVRELDDSGRYGEAVQAAIGPDPAGSGARFAALDGELSAAVDAERAGQTDDIGRAGAAQTLLATVPAVLFVLAAVAAALGIGRRVGEYR
jgi:hypothetical protein